MSCFVGTPVGGVRGSAGKAACGATAQSTRSVRSSRGVVCMATAPDYEKWKTLFAGGFPGGEAFYKQWIEEGATGDVPFLEDEKQPSKPNTKPVIYVEKPISNRGQQQGPLDPIWKTLYAGGFPGGEFFYKKWIEEGTTGNVPSLDTELQPTSASVSTPAPAAAQYSAPAAAQYSAPTPAASKPAAPGDIGVKMVVDEKTGQTKIVFEADGQEF